MTVLTTIAVTLSVIIISASFFSAGCKMLYDVRSPKLKELTEENKELLARLDEVESENLELRMSLEMAPHRRSLPAHDSESTISDGEMALRRASLVLENMSGSSSTPVAIMMGLVGMAAMASRSRASREGESSESPKLKDLSELKRRLRAKAQG